MSEKWYTLNLNPEPWAVGEVSVGRHGGRFKGTISPNPNLVAFQNAVREAMADVELLPPWYRKFTFYFFRQQAKYIDAADRVRQRNQADATNLQKGLEDALQGILFENDRNVLDIRSVICRQGHDVRPCILIKAERCPTGLVGMDELPEDLIEIAMGLKNEKEVEKGDRWSEAEQLF